MKHLTFLMLVVFGYTSGAQSFFDKTNDFLNRYVKSGQVDYQAIRSNRELLDELVTITGTMQVNQMTDSQRKAFYLNAYNILVIRAVVDLYPIEGPLAVDGFFDGRTFLVSGQARTLNQLEKDLLFHEFPDPRLHFVLVCAARGCPPLASFAYTPQSLDKQLEERTKYVLNLPGFILVNGERAVLPRIFEWYEKDFTNSGKTLVGFVNQYRTEKISEKKNIGFYEYDWSLNDRKK